MSLGNIRTKIPDFSTNNDSEGKYTSYRIVASTAFSTWNVFRRSILDQKSECPADSGWNALQEIDEPGRWEIFGDAQLRIIDGAQGAEPCDVLAIQRLLDAIHRTAIHLLVDYLVDGRVRGNSEMMAS